MNPANFLESLNQDLLVKLSDEVRKDIIIMGDFNAKYAKGLIYATRLHGLNKFINKPTRVTEHSRTAIDLIFVNNSHSIVSHGIQEFDQTILLFLLSRKLEFTRLLRKFAE